MPSRANGTPPLPRALGLLLLATSLRALGDEVALPEGPFAVLGDTQRAGFVERFFLGRERDDAAQARLVSSLAAERPAFVVLLGDLVFNAASDRQWRFFDVLFAPIGSAGVPLVPVLGNHDYDGGRAGRRRNLLARFPELEARSWSARRAGPLGLVLLDSNLAELGAERRAEQRRFLAGALERFDAEPGVSGVLVFAHHPPFTNSTVTADERDVAAEFLEPFLAARKTLAFVSGHAHAYERFHERGRTFLVSGGGGGPRVELLAGTARRHVDLYDAPSPRPWHYLVVEAGAAAARVRVVGLSSRDAPIAPLEAFDLPYAAPVDAKPRRPDP